MFFLSLLVPYSPWSIGLFIVSFHLFLTIAILAASVHVLNPISHLSLSTVLLLFLSDNTSFSSLLVPMLAQFLVINLVSFLIYACPIHLHLCVFICVLILSDLVLSHLLLSLANGFSEFFVSICVGSCPVCPHPFLSCARSCCHIRGQSEHLS